MESGKVCRLSRGEAAYICYLVVGVILGRGGHISSDTPLQRGLLLPPIIEAIHICLYDCTPVFPPHVYPLQASSNPQPPLQLICLVYGWMGRVLDCLIDGLNGRALWRFQYMPRPMAVDMLLASMIEFCSSLWPF